MKPGDLVTINLPDCTDKGLIIEQVDYRQGSIWLVFWDDGELEPMHQDDIRKL
tara:strand:+ start:365 stop:523 length:159 start_codon:yes stop_codon:yes gene_type:complete